MTGSNGESFNSSKPSSSGSNCMLALSTLAASGITADSLVSLGGR